MTGIVGRGDELAAVDRFLGRPVPAALVIEGDAGIGKTILWREGVRRAEAQGWRALVASPTESERQLPYAALADLVGDTSGEVRDQLPQPQRRALGVALLLEEPESTPPDRRAVAVALLGALRLLAAGVTVLLAIDDVQWLDSDSASVLDFLVRRLGEVPIALLLARRREREDEPPPLGLDRTSVPVERMGVGGLSVGATAVLLREQLGASFRRPMLRRIHETSDGNPLFALGLARGLLDAGQAEVDRELPLPRSLREVVQERLAPLPPETSSALLAVAALSDPTHSALDQALGRQWEELVRPGLAAGVVDLHGERIRFTHPLLRSVLYADAAPEVRQALHQRLSRLDLPLEERARHLALAATGVDARTADILEEGARAAALRGAPGVAAELAVQAVERSDPDDAESVRRRRYLAADEYAAAGDVDRARREVEAIVADAPPGPVRARALLRLAKNPRDIAESEALCEQALGETADDSVLRCDVLLFLAKLTLVLGQRDRTEQLLREATAIASEIGDDARRSHVEIWRAFVDWAAGRAFDRDSLDAAGWVDGKLLEHRASLEDRASYIRALLLRNINEIDEARRAWLALEQIATETGDETARADILNSLAKIEYAAGNWREGARYDDEAVELAEEVGLEHALAANLADRAEHAALRGLVEATRADAERSLEVAGRTHEQFTVARARHAFALAALLCGDYAQAVSESGQALAILEQLDYFGGVGTRLLPTAVAANIGHGNLEQAHRATEQLEELAAETGLAGVRAEALRCRGLVVAARGDVERSLKCLEEAAALAEDVPLRFERARTLLDLGTVQRRARRKRAARETLVAALAIFESLGSLAWAEQTRAEIARIGGRAGSPAELTPTEQRVAALVAEGKTNKEVAAELVVSVRAVEANLSRIYGKLGIRSRAELARRYRAEESP